MRRGKLSEFNEKRRRRERMEKREMAGRESVRVVESCCAGKQYVRKWLSVVGKKREGTPPTFPSPHRAQ